MLGDFASAARFYMTDNLSRVCTMWARNREGVKIPPEDVGRVLPLLPLASLVSDDELQERWALLLAATAAEQPGVLPSFGQILAQLTAEEARYLDRLWRGPGCPSIKLRSSRSPHNAAPGQEAFHRSRLACSG